MFFRSSFFVDLFTGLTVPTHLVLSGGVDAAALERIGSEVLPHL